MGAGAGSHSCSPLPAPRYFDYMAPRQLPIFPLPLVLFPGTPQLLHIFEPRYRQMLADCEDADGTFGLSFISEDLTADGTPSPGDVGCMAQVQAVHHLPDGRANIMTVGRDRYVLRSYVETDRLYHVGVVEPFDDDEEEDLDGPARSVRQHFSRLVETLGTLGGVTPPIELPGDPRALSFRVAAALDISVEIKQQLLELRSTSERLQKLQDILHHLTDDANRQVSLHLRVKRNGKTGSSVTMGE